MQLLSPPTLRAIETRLADLLRERLMCDGLQQLEACISQYVLAGGKRIRPQLCLWTWQHLSDRVAPASLIDLACGWELFHAFLLAHDDIIDGSDTRRSAPSLHVSLASLDSDSLTFGKNLGIVAGDLLYTAAMGLWIDADLPAPLYKRQLKLLNRVSAMTGFGQAIDICLGHAPLGSVADEQLLLEYHWKTAAYTFEGPMLTAAIAAEVSPQQEAAITRFALALGQAYQLQNDLNDLAAPAHEGSDLTQGKRTVTLLRYRATLNDDERLMLDCQLADGTMPVTQAEVLRQRVLKSKAVRSTRDLIDYFLADADAARYRLPTTLADATGKLMESLRPYFGVGA